MGVMKMLAHRAAGATVTGDTIALTDPTGVYQVFIREGGSDPSDTSEAAGDRTGWAMVSGGDNAAGVAFTVTDEVTGPSYGPGTIFTDTTGLLGVDIAGAAETGLWMYWDGILADASINVMRFDGGQGLTWNSSGPNFRARMGNVNLQHATAAPSYGTRWQYMARYAPGTPLVGRTATRIGGTWVTDTATNVTGVNSMDCTGDFTLGCLSGGTSGHPMTLYRFALGVGTDVPVFADIINNDVLIVDSTGNPAAASELHDYIGTLGDFNLLVDTYGPASEYTAGNNQAPGGVSLSKNGAGTFENAA